MRLLKRIRDFADVNHEKTISLKRASNALNSLGVNELGFDEMDIRYLDILLEQNSRPIGLSTIAAALSEDEGTIEDVIEPYLLANGYIEKTSKGRILRDRGYKVFGKKQDMGLFNEE